MVIERGGVAVGGGLSGRVVVCCLWEGVSCGGGVASGAGACLGAVVIFGVCEKFPGVEKKEEVGQRAGFHQRPARRTAGLSRPEDQRGARQEQGL